MTRTTITETVTVTSSTTMRRTTITETVTKTTQTIIVPCLEGLPTSIVGVNASQCVGLVTHQSCAVTCLDGYEGPEVLYTCGTDGQFAGASTPSCSRLTCTRIVPEGYDNSSCVGREVGEFCTVSCPVGYDGGDELFQCQSDKTFKGDLPNCTRSTCREETLPLTNGANFSNCITHPTLTGESCIVDCLIGWEGPSTEISCMESKMYEGSAPTCTLKTCNASAHNNPEIHSTCADTNYGQTCIVECADGYNGVAQELLCDADPS